MGCGPHLELDEFEIHPRPECIMVVPPLGDRVGQLVEHQPLAATTLGPVATWAAAQGPRAEVDPSTQAAVSVVGVGTSGTLARLQVDIDAPELRPPALKPLG